MEEKEKVEVHQESGLSFYKIKLVDDGENAIYLRLFDTEKPGRLKWENDEETHDEYKVRRAYCQKLDKQRKQGQLMWDSSWGPLTKENALRVQSLINNQQ